ncbi:hypothetical protein [Frateuria terrea]|uniref:Uncharacterized protein n=1 Tax=Frateuria terrea TaxID=529704 RepID=A0A1H6ZTZ7_9GAMM|nr:hypothetical protein [Frateuria terrea]SEJ55077.1 hypothetical protein SAMN04487997_0183 [Frateuria terrea]SFP47437.1 hypothetical protein SAMN02927913_2207 [Frateuria terrea]
MNAHELGFDLQALASPKSHEDFMALAAEARTEFALLHSRMNAILAAERAARLPKEEAL